MTGIAAVVAEPLEKASQGEKYLEKLELEISLRDYSQVLYMLCYIILGYFCRLYQVFSGPQDCYTSILTPSCNLCPQLGILKADAFYLIISLGNCHHQNVWLSLNLIFGVYFLFTNGQH